MSRIIASSALLMLLAAAAHAQDAANPEAEAAASEPAAADEQTPTQTAGTSPDQPKTMSGMSILGNEEAPKSLVIVPWKSSRLGDELALTDSLDERARPVDKEVFLRELDYYGIRSEN